MMARIRHLTIGIARFADCAFAALWRALESGHSSRTAWGHFYPLAGRPWLANRPGTQSVVCGPVQLALAHGTEDLSELMWGIDKSV
jgi:hypothetical protein